MPCLFVNGERFEFSLEVLERGNLLFKAFTDLHHGLRCAYLKSTSGPNVEEIKQGLKKNLEFFDSSWALYEELYVAELMKIESEARRLIKEAIELEKELQTWENENEVRAFSTKDSHFFETRGALSRVIGKLNAVSNFEGHGRDDLDHGVLVAAEDLLLRVASSESESVRKLATAVKKTFKDLRDLFRKYAENIEIVDPQLRNNEELVEALLNYERSWEKGRLYFLDKKRCDQLIYLSNVLEGLSEKFSEFREKIECYDAEVFLIIPQILLLKKIDAGDKGICDTFLPKLVESSDQTYQSFSRIRNSFLKINARYNRSKEIQKPFVKSRATRARPDSASMKTLLGCAQTKGATGDMTKKLSQDFYNLIERIIVGGNCRRQVASFGLEEDCEEIEEAMKTIGGLGIEIQRFDPGEWNSFLDLAIDNKSK